MDTVKTAKEGIFFWSVFGVAVGLMITSWLWLPLVEFMFTPDYAAAATSDTVTVTASVTTVLSCSTDITTTDFGTLTDSVVTTSSVSASTTMACTNSSAGCTLNIQDVGDTSNPGLWNSTSSALIESPNAAFSATATLVAGTEGFGIRATTSSAGGGQVFSLLARYSQSGELSGSAEDVGGLSVTNLILASTTASTSGREVVVTHKAAIATLTPGGTYNDTITYSCLAN